MKRRRNFGQRINPRIVSRSICWWERRLGHTPGRFADYFAKELLLATAMTRKRIDATSDAKAGLIFERESVNFDIASIRSFKSVTEGVPCIVIPPAFWAISVCLDCCQALKTD